MVKHGCVFGLLAAAIAAGMALTFPAVRAQTRDASATELTLFTTSMKGSLESRHTSTERSAPGLSSHPGALSEQVDALVVGSYHSSHAPGA